MFTFGLSCSRKRTSHGKGAFLWLRDVQFPGRERPDQFDAYLVISE